MKKTLANPTPLICTSTEPIGILAFQKLQEWAQEWVISVTIRVGNISNKSNNTVVDDTTETNNNTTDDTTDVSTSDTELDIETHVKTHQ